MNLPRPQKTKTVPCAKLFGTRFTAETHIHILNGGSTVHTIIIPYKNTLRINNQRGHG